MKHLEKHPIPIVAIGVTGAALSAIFVKYSDAPALIIATYRLLWTVLLMSPVILGSKSIRTELKNTNIKNLSLCTVSGIFLALHFTLWFESLSRTSVASSTAIISTEVIWVALGFSFFPEGKMPRKAWFFIFITVIGSIIIAMADFSAGFNNLTGDILALVSAVFAAIYTLIGRFSRTSMTTTSYTFIVYLFCAISLCVTVAIRNMPFTGYGMSAVWVGLLLCVFSTFLGHSIFSWSLKFLSPSFVSASKLCQSVIAAVLAFFLFEEIPSFFLIIGGLLTIAGVMLYSKIEASDQ